MGFSNWVITYKNIKIVLAILVVIGLVLAVS